MQKQNSNKMLKIKEIRVEKLFDIFDHQIVLNDGGLTLMLGENGFGKTVLLKMIQALFEKNYTFFYQLIFKKFIIKFSNDKSIIISKVSDNKTNKRLSIECEKNNVIAPEKIIVNEEIVNMGFIGNNPKYVVNQKDLVAITIIDNKKKTEKPQWFIEILQKINISIIETQRLYKLNIKNNISNNKVQELTINLLSNEIAELLKILLAKSSELSQKLDSTYLSRLTENRKQLQNRTFEELYVDLDKIKKKRELLHSVGLLDKELDKEFQYEGDEDDFLKTVLMVYVEDSYEKLKIFDDLANKIKLFKTIINKRFLYKRLRIDKEKGFVFISKITGKEIPLSGLSSGEQHEIVLFYTLLFKIQPQTFILIDEPEISLHISWQNDFIEDLKEIIEITKLNILIATHSPNIIGNNWDITTELKRLDSSLLIEDDDD